MTKSSSISVTLFVAWRNLRVLFKSPVLVISIFAVPVIFFAAFAGALGKVTDIKGFGTSDYNSFQYVFAMMLTAALTGGGAGTAIVEDYESGFMGRLLIAAPKRAAIAAGYILAMVARTTIQVAGLTGAAFAFKMDVNGGALDMLGLYGLAFLLNVTTAQWAAGIALRARGGAATPGIILPIFMLIFLSAVFLPLHLLTGWLHDVARFNPFTRFLEAGRSLINGTPKEVGYAFAVAGGMALLTALWALFGVRKAEAAGPP